MNPQNENVSKPQQPGQQAKQQVSESHKAGDQKREDQAGRDQREQPVPMKKSNDQDSDLESVSTKGAVQGGV